MRNSEKPSGLFLPKQLDKEIKTDSLVIVCAHVGVLASVCVCVRERERERVPGRETQREKDYFVIVRVPLFCEFIMRGRR